MLFAEVKIDNFIEQGKRKKCDPSIETQRCKDRDVLTCAKHCTLNLESSVLPIKKKKINLTRIAFKNKSAFNRTIAD